MTEKQDQRTYLTQQEREKFFKVIHSKRDVYMFNLIYYLGLRVGEASELRLDAIDDEGYIYVQGLKGGRARGYELKKNPELWKQHRSWMRERVKIADSANPYLFITERSGKDRPIKRETIQYLFKTYGKRAELPARFSVHSLRHSCGCALAAKGFPVQAIMRWLRQRRISSAQVYTELVGAELKMEEDAISKSFNS